MTGVESAPSQNITNLKGCLSEQPPSQFLGEWLPATNYLVFDVEEMPLALAAPATLPVEPEPNEGTGFARLAATAAVGTPLPNGLLRDSLDGFALNALPEFVDGVLGLAASIALQVA
ncbi:MAG: hypothetical protein EAZ30_07030 [Betaproteobacteria bacterium]|nr:MAG: hypothetical protein EAZ30_07030 [Betaproteobacteria bacterium]